MEFDEHEEQEGEIGINNSGGRKSEGGGGGGGGTTGAEAGTTTAASTTTYRYRECLKNHAVGIGGNAVDGCGEFMAAGPDGTLQSLLCAACSCHRNFHRKETEGGGGGGVGGGGGEGFHHHHHPPLHHHHHPHLTTAYSFRSPHPSGYLHVTPPTRPLALPATSEDMSNPSSSGGGASGGGGSKKRFRTRFTAEQKEQMLAFAERLGWRIQKQDEDLVQQFCAETNVRRHVLKVWMHNNKHTLGKKP